MEKENQTEVTFHMFVKPQDNDGQNVWEKLFLDDQFDDADEPVLCSLAELRLP